MVRSKAGRVDVHRSWTEKDLLKSGRMGRKDVHVSLGEVKRES